MLGRELVYPFEVRFRVKQRAAHETRKIHATITACALFEAIQVTETLPSGVAAPTSPNHLWASSDAASIENVGASPSRTSPSVSTPGRYRSSRSVIRAA